MCVPRWIGSVNVFQLLLSSYVARTRCFIVYKDKPVYIVSLEFFFRVNFDPTLRWSSRRLNYISRSMRSAHSTHSEESWAHFFSTLFPTRLSIPISSSRNNTRPERNLIIFRRRALFDPARQPAGANVLINPITAAGQSRPVSGRRGAVRNDANYCDGPYTGPALFSRFGPATCASESRRRFWFNCGRFRATGVINQPVIDAGLADVVSACRQLTSYVHLYIFLMSNLALIWKFVFKSISCVFKTASIFLFKYWFYFDW